MAVPAKWAFGIPLLACAVVFIVQPGHRLGPPIARAGNSERQFRDRWLYDDVDIAAFVQRGLNANRGRLAGRIDEPLEVEPEEFRQRLDANAPLETSYYLEYPRGVLYFFEIADTLAETPHELPSAVLDSRHHNLVLHQPRNADEQALWQSFRRSARGCTLLSLLALLATMGLLYRELTRRGDATKSLWLLVLPGALYSTLMRFDIIPSFLVLAALLAADRRRPVLSGALLALAILTKAYPIVLAPLILRTVAGRSRDLIAWLAGAMVMTMIVFAPDILAGFDVQRVLTPYRIQFGRAPEFEWSLFGNVLPYQFGLKTTAATLLRLGILAIAVLATAWQKPADTASLVRKSIITLIIFSGVQTFYSAHWMMWVTPLIVLAVPDRPRLFLMAIAWDAVTYLTFPVACDLVMFPEIYEPLRRVLVAARAILWLLILMQVSRAARVKCTPDG